MIDAGFRWHEDPARGRPGIKWTRYGPDVLAAWVAEMDAAVAPPIADALTEALARGELGYPSRTADTGLPTACCAWLARTSGWTVSPHRVVLVPDTLSGMDVALRFLGPRDAPVVVPTPAYPPLLALASGAGRPLVSVPMTTANPAGPYLDLDAIDTALAPSGGTVLLCHPHNPTGVVVPRDELVALSRVVARRGGRVIADEVHAPLVYPGVMHTPYASVSPEAADHTVTVVSASKAWNVPGLKCAQVILTNDDDLATWRALGLPSRGAAGSLGIVAALAAYRHGDTWRHAALENLSVNRALITETLPELLPELTWRPPDATYLAWLDCSALGLDDPAGTFLRVGRVALADGRAFGSGGDGRVRLTFATAPATLRRALEALALARRTVCRA